MGKRLGIVNGEIAYLPDTPTPSMVEMTRAAEGTPTITEASNGIEVDRTSSGRGITTNYRHFA